MTIFEDIAEAKRLRERLQSLERHIYLTQNACKHSWSEPEQKHKPYKEPVFSHLEGHGSDPIARFNYVDRTKPVWVRNCTKCGLEQKTEKTKPTAVGPDFGS